MKHLSKGAIHLHSTYSDGTGTIREIADAAKITGLDWIIITDHNTLAGLKNGEEGWYDGVAVIIGNEITPDEGNHYLAAGIKEEICCKHPPEEFVRRVGEQGGIGFIAHPDESLSRRNNSPPLRWKNWDTNGFNGIEIWNYVSDWVDNYDTRNPLYCAFARNRILKGPTSNVLRWWDDLNSKTPDIVPAIGGLDTHAFKFGPFRIFPYSDSFKTITNYVFLEEKLSPSFETAKKQLLNALKTGSNIIVNRIWNRGSDTISFNHTGARLSVSLPHRGLIRLLRNGRVVFEKEGSELRYDSPSPGKYRFEAYYRGKPWIFSNPVMI